MGWVARVCVWDLSDLVQNEEENVFDDKNEEDDECEFMMGIEKMMRMKTMLILFLFLFLTR